MNFNTQGLKVMVAENDRTVLELLQIRLDIAGFGTCMARTGVMALETLKTFRPAALVMELNLPEMNGFEVLKALNPRRQKLPFPVLIMAKNLGAEDIAQALALGAQDCMAKPFSGVDALERVTRLLRRSSPAPRRMVYV
jgi:two-component system catabolic regulation response regulator CreB